MPVIVMPARVQNNQKVQEVKKPIKKEISRKAVRGKSFVSLSFATKRLQAVKLNRERTKAEKFGSFALPDGLIVENKVTNTKTLSDILKGVWKKLGLRETSVGLIVPEFSTFTRSVTLPVIDIKDLNEAVYWQSKDINTDSAGMVMDWKIVNKTDSEFQILAVTAQKTVLDSFVDSVALAGLFPLVVETPSLSLSRVAPESNVGRLIVYSNFGEAVILVAQGERVLGSSVIGVNHGDAIVQTARQIVGYYDKVDIKEVIIAGLGFDQNSIAKLQQVLGQKATWADVRVGGFTKWQLQEYLVPISMQLGEPLAPKDEETINLLPEDWIKYYEKKDLGKWSVRISTTILISLLIIFLGLLTAYLMMDVEAEALTNAGYSDTTGVSQETLDKVAEMNKIALATSAISDIYALPQDVINTIGEATPAGVVIIGQKINLENGLVNIDGVAANREKLITFRKNLEQNEDVSGINIPVSSFENEINLDFTLDFFFEPLKTNKPKKIKLQV